MHVEPLGRERDRARVENRRLDDLTRADVELLSQGERAVDCDFHGKVPGPACCKRRVLGKHALVFSRMINLTHLAGGVKRIVCAAPLLVGQGDAARQAPPGAEAQLAVGAGLASARRLLGPLLYLENRRGPTFGPTFGPT